MSNPPNKLPDKLWQLLELAIQSAKDLNPANYQLDMSTWYHASANPAFRCHVCLAGAVMVCKLGVVTNGSVRPEEFDDETRDKLRAIDCLRGGRLQGACEMLGLPQAPPDAVLLDRCDYAGAAREAPWEYDWYAHRALMMELKRLDL
jgi:hypothetical protein